MTVNVAAAGAPQIQIHEPDPQYHAGACNIGHDEIRRRWRFGHEMVLLALVVFAVLVLLHVPALLRFVVAAPVAVGAACYLEAALKFCVRFGMRGLFNFGALGAEGTVVDPVARARDRRRARQLAAASLAVALLVGAVAVLLPF